jgi:hypothetical protein
MDAEHPLAEPGAELVAHQVDTGFRHDVLTCEIYWTNTRCRRPGCCDVTSAIPTELSQKPGGRHLVGDT